jgi:tetratricopeptide (TPR) repeat protein
MHARSALTLITLFALASTLTPARTQADLPAAPQAPPAAAPSHAPVLGDALFAAGDFAAAARSYESTLQADPHNAGADLGLARIALYRNDLSSLEAHARALAADDPNDPRAQRLLAAIGVRRGDAPDIRADALAGEVDVPLVQVDPLPVIDSSVDGKPARLLLDTGGTGLDLATTFAQKIGLATQSAGQGVFAGGLHAEVRKGHVDRLDLGAATVRSLPVSVIDQIPPDIDGVLGTNVLYDFLSTIDYQNRKLILRPKSQSTAFERAAAARGATIVPMFLVPDHFIFVRARAGSGPEALYNVDTGGGGIGVQLTKTSLDAAGIVPDATHSISFHGGGGDAHAIPFVADVTLGERTWRGLPGLYFDNGDQYGIFPFAVAGTLSHELFKRGALTFDFTAMRLVFEAP